jgi:nitrogen fixation protein NifQ
MGSSLRGMHTMSDDTLPSSSATPAAAAAPTERPGEACAERAGQWMATAVDVRSFDTYLFAKLIAAREVRGEWALLGLSQPQWDGLVSRHFAGEPALAALPRSFGLAGLRDTAGLRDPLDSAATAVPMTLSKHEHVEFVAALRALLLRYVNPAVLLDDAECLASVIAHACLRPDHLWRDLGLAGRDEVSAMLERYFPSLVVLNVENLRWKKFLARQLALSLGKEPGPAPGCPGCEDYGYCFPPAA